MQQVTSLVVWQSPWLTALVATEQLLPRNAKRFRGGLVFKADRWWLQKVTHLPPVRKAAAGGEKSEQPCTDSSVRTTSFPCRAQGYLAHKKQPPPRTLQ